MWRLSLVLAGSLLVCPLAFAETTFDYNPLTGKLDLTLDNSNAGVITGITATFTGYNCSTFASGGTLTTDAAGNLRCQDDDTGAGGDPILVNTTAVGDAAGVDLTTGTGVSVTLNAGVSPDTATFDIVDDSVGATELADADFGDWTCADGAGGCLVDANAVALTTDTTGNYVSSATANEGLTLTGTEGASLGIQDCAANEIMKRNAGDTAWACAADADSGGATAWDAIGNPAGTGAVAMAETVQTLDWDSAATAAAYDGLSLTATHDSTTDSSTQRLLVVERLATTGTAAWETLMQIQNNDTDGAVTTGLEILSAAGAITTAIDVSDPEIGTALSIGANSVTAADAALVDLDAINNSGATEGLLLPQGTAITTGTAEGQIGWDTDDDELRVGTGTATVRIGGFFIGGGTFTGQTATHELPLWGLGAEAATSIGVLPVAVTCSGFAFSTSVAPDNGAGTQTWTPSVAINGTAGAITCTQSETATNCTDTSNTMSFTAGQAVEVQVVAANTPASSDDESWVLMCYPD